MTLYFVYFEVHRNGEIIRRASGNMTMEKPIETHEELEEAMTSFKVDMLKKEQDFSIIHITNISRL